MSSRALAQARSVATVPHVAVAAARAQTLAPRGYNGERLPEVTLPADTWHAWFPMEERTLCGLAVTDLHQFPLLPFLPERANDLCRPCLMGARAELTAEHSEARLGAVMEYFVGSEQISQLRRPGSGPTPVPAGKLHAIRLGSITTACGIALEAVHRWREVEWSPQPGRDWCRACRTQTAP
jgi:hypothetical protein